MECPIINIIDYKENAEVLLNMQNREELIRKDVVDRVNIILNNIKERGDQALIEYTNKFDSTLINIKNICVTEEEIKYAYDKVDKKFLEAIYFAKKNIEEFHSKQKENSWIDTSKEEIMLGQIIRPLERVAIYVPGGTASYPSSVLMNAVPAKVAGVKEIVMITPPSKNGEINPNILVAADIAGVDKIYKIGGAQAVAAMAFGTKTIKKVDKIVGPGNIYVAMAKRSVYGHVDIDMIAGPSEILIIADKYANPKFIAADLMSQAEHDKIASAILVTNSLDIAKNVQLEIKNQIENLKRKEIIKSSLKNYGGILLVKDINEAINIANNIAPEHLELMVKNPFNILNEIKNAGSIFLGEFSPEPLGDYIAGPNHVLPTNGTARFFSPLSVEDFMKKSNFLCYSQNKLLNVKDKIVKLANTEGLTAHANSIKVRFE
ncbi:histidinol dehydrogenase [Clostridium acetireducens DSM 10703]|uniref:Histidinol dehydrogenase n=1 Tax=Clostridium acetireducens DSM 10703 TaxID=1121290 RepID=A0A1E8EX37_9CLOT|nr:histidinol dehydrogenase [Clostridium acetireducens]OFI05358.1 histidinol dehydrogenase [Clostridium acetireducens DSM 10703]